MERTEDIERLLFQLEGHALDARESSQDDLADDLDETLDLLQRLYPPIDEPD